MKKLLTLFFILSFSAVFGQDLESILEKHYEVMGIEKIAAIKTSRLKMTMNMAGSAVIMDMSLKNPDKIYAEMNVNGMDMIMVVNGDDGIMKMGDQIMPMDEAQKEQLIGQLNLEGDLYNYKEKGHKVTYRGMELIDGKDFYLLDAILKGKEATPFVMYLDAESYMIDKMEITIEQGGQSMLMTLTVDDVYEMDGMVIVNKMSSVMNGTTVMDFVISDIEFDVDLDESLFSLE